MAEREITYREAIIEGIAQEMRRDPTVIIMGEDIAGGAGRADQGIVDSWGGVLGSTKGLITEFGADRVRDTPISESGFTGAGVGAAMTGLRPVVELMFIDFLGVTFDQIYNQAAKVRYMFGGSVKVPMVIKGMMGGSLGGAAQHSQMLYSLFAHIPGLKVAVPSTPYDVKGLYASAIRDDDPIVMCEHKALYNSTGEVPEGEYTVPLGKADMKREGGDITVVALSMMVPRTLEAAEKLAAESIQAEVIDPRCLSPLDEETILNSVAKTGRLLVVDEGYPRCGAARDIVALVAEQAFDSLESPPRCVTAPHTPVPFSPPMEDFYVPDADDIVAGVHEVLES
jgi:pyruvate/2-oxoglutarate/acetoin dehydrogenase E1 component